MRALCLLSVSLLVLVGCSGGGGGQPEAVGQGESPALRTHLSQAAIDGGSVAPTEILDHGALVFGTLLNGLDGVGRPTMCGDGSPRTARTGREAFNRISGPTSVSCSTCHDAGRGGAGDHTANAFVGAEVLPFASFDGGEGDLFGQWDLDTVAQERNPRSFAGAGWLALAAREMTMTLRAQRDAALAQAQSAQFPVFVNFSAQGVSFGSAQIFPDGTYTPVSTDLDQEVRVRPLSALGAADSLRDMVLMEGRRHLGMVGSELVGAGTDGDGDGVADELSAGDVTALTLWLATRPMPGEVVPDDPAMVNVVASGRALFGPQAAGGFGCAECHLPAVTVSSATFTTPGPFPSSFAPHTAALAPVPTAVDLASTGPGPFPAPNQSGVYVLKAYTDFQSHDLGPENAENLPGGGTTQRHRTPPLWGLRDTGPWLRHGRALSITQAILAHGGEAAAARGAFQAANQADQEALLAFLNTLRILPDGSPSLQPVASGAVVAGEEGTLPTATLQADIDAGVFTPAELMARGAVFFSARFKEFEGGNRPETNGGGAPRAPRVFPENLNRISGPDGTACVGCHSIPGPGGGGDNHANVFVLAQVNPFINFDGGAGDGFVNWTLQDVGNERNTPGMWGSGFIEMLSREMSFELQALRDGAVADAQSTQQPVTVQLVAKGVSFGSLTADPSGAIAYTVEGVNEDLVIRPFHQKGVAESLRVFTNNASNHHHGMQASERFGADADNDGVLLEIEPGDVTAAVLFQAGLRVPGRVLPADAGRQAAVLVGEDLFNRSLADGGIGCAECHVPALRLDSPLFTEPSPFNPAGNLRPTDVPQPFAFDLTQDGQSPRLPKESDGSVLVPAYTDLKRWDMGPENAEPIVQGGVPTSHFLTKKLWGFFSEPPFMSHGRATTVTQAIQMHGGDAAASRDAFSALDAENRARVIDFLKTLQVVPEGGPRVVTQ